MSAPRPIRAATKAEWLRRRAQLRPRVLRALGLDPQPDRIPLDVRVGGSLERSGYSIQRVYWQTWPSVWASGWLYRPALLASPAPAVLSLHGHWEEGARHPTVQHRHVALALLGYVTLAVDAAHIYDYPTGLTPLTVMTWSNVRALDYLAGLPEVNRERIGLIGESGGALQAMYLLAVDDRPRAAVLAIMVSYFRRILMRDAAHCACNHVPGILRFTDEPELCGIASPRALQFLTAREDWTAPFPDHELGELRALYRLWLQPDRLDHRQFPGPHDTPRAMREAAYLWLGRELRGDRELDVVLEPEQEMEDPAALLALDDPPPENRGAGGVIAWFRRTHHAVPPRLEGRSQRRAHRDRLRDELEDLLGLDVPAAALDVRREEDGSGGISVCSEPDVRVPFRWTPGEPRSPALIVLDPAGREGAERSAWTRAARRRGWGTLLPDVRLTGSLSRDWLLNCTLWGRPEAGMAVTDVRACVQWLWEQADAPDRVFIAGCGSQGVAALLAGGCEERLAGVAADCLGTLYQDEGTGLPVIPGILRVGDIPQFAGLIAPRRLFLHGVAPGRAGFASRRYYDWTVRTYQSLGSLDDLRLETRSPSSAGEIEEALDWLSAARRRG